jgi:hypothetical protein
MRLIAFVLILFLVAVPTFAGDKYVSSLVAPAEFYALVFVTNFGPESVRVVALQYEFRDNSLVLIGTEDRVLGPLKPMVVPVFPKRNNQQMEIITCAPADIICSASTTQVDALLSVGGYFYDGQLEFVVPITFEKE